MNITTLYIPTNATMQTYGNQDNAIQRPNNKLKILMRFINRLASSRCLVFLYGICYPIYSVIDLPVKTTSSTNADLIVYVQIFSYIGLF
jgi:hypothetical protein